MAELSALGQRSTMMHHCCDMTFLLAVNAAPNRSNSTHWLKAPSTVFHASSPNRRRGKGVAKCRHKRRAGRGPKANRAAVRR